MSDFYILLFPIFILLTAYIHQKIVGVSDTPIFLDRNYTTALKGVAILFIMYGHCACLWHGGRLTSPFGGVGVSLFLILSGYGLNESYLKRGLDGFWKKRISKVYIPYIIAALMLVLAGNISVSGGVILCYNAPYWFVTYIIECYVIFWICTRFLSRYRMYLFLALSLCALAFMSELQAEQSLSFITGIWMSEHKEKLKKNSGRQKNMVRIALAFLFVGILALAIKQLPLVREYSGTPVYSIVQLFIKWPLSLAVLLGAIWTPALLRNPFVMLSGVISYELYLVHFPFYGMIKERFWPAVVLWIGAFVVSWLFNKINNRISKLIA